MRELKATSAPTQSALEDKLLDEVELNEHGAAANQFLNAVQVFRSEIIAGAVANPAAAEDNSEATAASKRIPVYVAQTGPLRSRFFESKRLH